MNKHELSVSVTLDGETVESTDFVAVLAQEDGDTAMYFNTDALTLGMAMKMITRAFVNCLKELNEEERDSICSVLGFTEDEESEVADA